MPGPPIARALLAVLIVSPLLPSLALGEWVAASERVESRVIVRERALRHSTDIGSLRPGEHAQLLDTRQGWHQVLLQDGTPGFVSAAWTQLVPDPEPDWPVEITRLEREPRSSFLRRVRSSLHSLLPWSLRVDARCAATSTPSCPSRASPRRRAPPGTSTWCS